jgi:hypothetical protein
MLTRLRLPVIGFLLAVLSVVGFVGLSVRAAPQAAGVGSFTRQIASGGTSSFAAVSEGADGIESPEFRDVGESEAAASPFAGTIVNRSHSKSKRGARGASVHAGKKSKSNPELTVSFDGLNFREQRLANGGNQFALEPPDQGLCAGNGFVVEVVNDVLRVFSPGGAALTPVFDLNTFYGYPAAINRATGARGQFLTDPSCLFDQTIQRFILVVLTLEVKPTAPSAGAFLGANHLDIAVSRTADPTGPWTIYRLPVQDDGTQGTPNHHCFADPEPPAYRTNPRACLGDYPHIGADKTGFYITTNEYEFFGDTFIGAQIYAFSKEELASGAAAVTVTQIDTSHAAPGGKPGFTVWPAQSPGNQFAGAHGGTEYFLSSTAAAEARCDSQTECDDFGISNNIVLWSLSGTSSLDSSNPSLSLDVSAMTVGDYAIPPQSNQKPGDFPQGQCINDTTTVITSLGPPFTGCWRALLVSEPAHDEVISHLDSNDTRMQQVMYANGKLWGALDTAVTVNSVNKAGIEWFIVNPHNASVRNSGYLALERNNVIYPAIGVTQSGRGVMAFTLVGADHYPTAAYASIDDKAGVGDVHVAAEGLGPDDGFTSYKAQVGNPPRTRWGDYGAAAVDGNAIWIASEYIGQTCTLAQYIAAPFGSCGGTRTSSGNWGTRISRLVP